MVGCLCKMCMRGRAVPFYKPPLTYHRYRPSTNSFRVTVHPFSREQLSHKELAELKISEAEDRAKEKENGRRMSATPSHPSPHPL